MRLTLDEAMKLSDRFEEFIMDNVGEDVRVRRPPEAFLVEVLRAKPRKRPDAQK